MRTILVLFLISLVVSSSIDVQPLPVEKPQQLYLNPQKYIACMKQELLKDPTLPSVIKEVEAAIKQRDFMTLIKLGKMKAPELIAMNQKCYASSFSTEVQLKNIFGDIGGILKGVVKDLVSIGKDAWKNVLGDVKNIFENKGQTLINDIYAGLKATGEKILTNLLSAAKDALKNLLLDALKDPAHAIDHLNASLKNLPSIIKDGALGFRLPEGSVTQMNIDQIKELVNGVRDDVRKEVKLALDKGRAYAKETCQKLINTDKLDLCKYVSLF